MWVIMLGARSVSGEGVAKIAQSDNSNARELDLLIALHLK